MNLSKRRLQQIIKEETDTVMTDIEEGLGDYLKGKWQDAFSPKPKMTGGIKTGPPKRMVDGEHVPYHGSPTQPGHPGHPAGAEAYVQDMGPGAQHSDDTGLSDEEVASGGLRNIRKAAIKKEPVALREENEDLDDRAEEEELNARLAALRGGPPAPNTLPNLRAFVAGEERSPRGAPDYTLSDADRDELYADEIAAQKFARQRALLLQLDAEAEALEQPAETVAATPWGGFADKESRDQAAWDQYLMDYPDVAAQGAPMPDVLPWETEEEETAAAIKGPSVAPPPSYKFDSSIPVKEALRRMVMEEIASMTEPAGLEEAEGAVRRKGRGQGQLLPNELGGRGTAEQWAAIFQQQADLEAAGLSGGMDLGPGSKGRDPEGKLTHAGTSDLEDMAARDMIRKAALAAGKDPKEWDPGKNKGAAELWQKMRRSRTKANVKRSSAAAERARAGGEVGFVHPAYPEEFEDPVGRASQQRSTQMQARGSRPEEEKLGTQQTQDTYKYELPWKDQYETEKYKPIAPRSDVAVPDYGAMAKKHKSTQQKESITRSNLRRMVMEELQEVYGATRINETLTRWQKIIKS